MPPKSGVAIAMSYFGRKPNQRLAEFKEEWDALDKESQAQLTAGITDETLTY
jgi:hypothetical protein